MRTIPESANRKDWPRLVRNTINEIIKRLRAEENKTTDSLEQITFTPIATPTSPTAGQTYFDSTSNKLRTYDGTSWQDLW